MPSSAAGLLADHIGVEDLENLVDAAFGDVMDDMDVALPVDRFDSDAEVHCDQDDQDEMDELLQRRGSADQDDQDDHDDQGSVEGSEVAGPSGSTTHPMRGPNDKEVLGVRCQGGDVVCESSGQDEKHEKHNEYDEKPHGVSHRTWQRL